MPEQEPSAAEQPGGDASTHDPTGLEAARSVAERLRGSATRPAPTRRRTGHRRPEPTLSGAHPDSRDPEPVGQAVSRLVEDSGWSTDVAVHGVFARWGQIVGPQVAAHTTPYSYRDQRLQVQADSTSWATQLRLLAPNLVARLNAELGDGTVLRIDVSGPSGPSWRKGPRTVSGGRGPRDTYG